MLASMPDRPRLHVLGVLLAAALGLAACGVSAEQARAAHEKHQQALHDASGGGAGTADDPDADLVLAVSRNGSGTPISLKFRLGGRPVVGMPLQLTIAVVPDTGATISHIHGSYSPGDGLQLQSPREFDLADLQGGAAVRQQLTVIPEQAGILSLSATLVLDLDTGTTTRSFGIPLIAVNPGS